MNAGKTLVAQLMDFLPWTTFACYVHRYGGDRGVRTLPCAKQCRIIAFAQFTSDLSGESARHRSLSVSPSRPASGSSS